MNGIQDEPVFSVGDRVILLADHPDENYSLFAGDTGVVLGREAYLSKDWVSVKWDGFNNGHSCGGLCPGDAGWNVPTRIITLETQIDETVIFSEGDLAELLLK